MYENDYALNSVHVDTFHFLSAEFKRIFDFFNFWRKY